MGWRSQWIAAKYRDAKFVSVLLYMAIVALYSQPQIAFGQSPTIPSSTTNAASLKDMIERTLQVNQKIRSLSAERNAAWQVIHGSIPYGDSLLLEIDGVDRPAIEYLLNGGELRGWDLTTSKVLPSTNRPGVLARVELGSFVGQGHPDQWLGYFSQIPLSLDRKMTVRGEVLSLLDWAHQVQWDVPNNAYLEYSWTLIALTNYFPQDREWIASDGKTWTLEPLVQFEAEQDLSESACGGMHRLMGLAHAVRYRKRLGDPFTGGWASAKKVVDDAIESARKFQNSDGSFSTNYTVRPGTSPDLATCISATGHSLEFLSYAMEPTDLSKEWLERACKRLCNMLKASESIDLECGGAYHALAGLKLYHDRRYSREKK